MSFIRRTYANQPDHSFHFPVAEELRANAAVLTHSRSHCRSILDLLESVREISALEQFSLYEGLYSGVPVAVAVTGIGPAASSLALHELIALGFLTFCKHGTIGSLQVDLGLGTLVLPIGAVRLDGTSSFYVDDRFPAVPDFQQFGLLEAGVSKSGAISRCGIVLTKNSYGSTLDFKDYEYWIDRDVLGIEMECSTLFTIATLKRVRMGAILVVNREVGKIRDQKSGTATEWSTNIEESIVIAGRIALDSLALRERSQLR